MTHNTHKTSIQLAMFALLAMLFATATHSAVAVTALQLGFTVPSSFNESNRQAVLEWNAEPAKTYLVQSADDLLPGTPWKTETPVTATQVGPVRWMAPEAIRDRKYYRLVLPQPEVFSVEPAFIDSSDPTALLYLMGQGLPTNGSVVINGQNYTPTLVDSNGGWVAISLNGLPPGTPVTGSLLVLDNASNIVTTLPLQSPIFYGTEMTAEQLQGPPEEIPASPECSWTKGGGASVGRSAEWTKGGGASVGRSAAWTKGGGASVGKPNPGRSSASWTKGGGASVGKPNLGHRSASWTKGGGASVGKANPGKYFASGDGDDDDGDGLDPDFSLLMPALMKAKEKANRSAAGSGAGVQPATGEMQLEEADFLIPGRGLDFVWTRTYRSRTGPNTAQGHGWDFSYNVSVTLQPDGTVILRSGNGRADTFYPNGTNGWTRDEYFVQIADGDQDGYPDAVTFADGGKWLFLPDATPTRGKLAQIIDRNGNTLAFTYDASGRLEAIVDTLDRTNTVAYNPVGQIASVTDFSGRTVRYEYDGNGDLSACISPPVIGTPNGNDFPGGKTNRYAYTRGLVDDRLNHNLTSCTDPLGQTWLQITYQATNNPASLDFDAVDFVMRGVDKKAIRRGMVMAKPGHLAPVLQAIVNDGVGNVSECFYDSRFRLVGLREFTGRANPKLPTTATENRPTDKLRTEDPDFFETRFEWNPDSLCTRILYPRGNATEMIYERAFNQNSARSNRAHAGDLRIINEIACCDQDDDGDGLPDSLTTTFEYDPRFGSPPTTRSGKIVCNYVRRERGAVTDDAVAKKVLGTFTLVGCGLRTTRMVDPRGIVTTGEYDDQGNQSRETTVAFNGGNGVEVRASSARHNSRGQLTTITNAPDGDGYRRVDTFSYYTNGPQAGYLEKMIVDVGGVVKTFRFSYDARGNVTQSVDPRGNDLLYTYNALDQLVRCQSPTNLVARSVTDFIYDANDNVAECVTELRDETDAFVRTIPSRTTFDVLDRPVAVIEQVSPSSFVTNSFSYDGNDNLVAAHSPMAVSGADPHNIVTFAYDERDLLFREIAAPGSGNSATNEFGYNPNGQTSRVTKIEALAIKQNKCTYDGFDRPVTITDPMSNVVSYAYDRNDNLIYCRTDAELNDQPGGAGNLRYHEWRWKYDALDRCVESRGTFFDPATRKPIGDGTSVSTCTYAPNGDCLSLTDDNGHVTRYTYDTASRLSSIADPKTNIASFTYDECDNVLSVTRTDRSDVTPGDQQFTIVHTYDKLQRLTRSVDNVGNTNRYAYDSLDNLVSAVDARDNETVYAYDDLSRCVQTTGYQGLGRGITINTSHVEYNVNSRCISAADANSNATFYAYDSLDRHIVTTNADGTTQKLVWSPHSNLVRSEDANGTVITNVYDLCDRLIHRDIIPGSGVAATTTFETFAYDGLSRLVAATNDASVCTFAYDSLGNCVRGVSGGLGAMTTTHDGVGNRLSITYPSGRLVTYTYNALDEVANVSSGSGGLPPTTLATFEYDGPGRVGRVSRGNSVNTRIQWNGLVNPPNTSGDFGWGQVRGINHQVAGGGTVIDQRRFTYDHQQNKTLRAQTAPFFGNGPMTTNVFEYDPLDRLSRAINTTGTGATVRLYTLDGVGNRQLVVSNGVAETYSMAATIPPGDFQMNQYTLTPFVIAPEQYDENGDLVGRITATAQLVYQYDYADRLVAVNDLATGSPTPVASYAYDALGRRISKTTYASGLPPITAEFLYDDGEIIEEYAAGTLAVTSVSSLAGSGGGAAAASYAATGRLAPPLATFSPAGAVTYLHADDLGNVLALTDASGAVIERYDYDDFGTPLFLTTDGFPIPDATASSVGNRFLFRGMEWDSETGFYYDGSADTFSVSYKATQGKTGKAKNALRYADPNTGRGITRCDDGSCSFGDNNPWSQRSINNINGGMPNRISMNVTVPKQTQGATFGEKVNAGLHAAGSALSQRYSPGGTKAQDHNSSRSNKTASIAHPGGGGGGSGGSKAQDHNSSRSNKTASMFDFGGGGGGGSSNDRTVLYSAKKGKTGSAK